MTDTGSELTVGIILICGFSITQTCLHITNAYSLKEDREMNEGVGLKGETVQPTFIMKNHWAFALIPVNHISV